jgi:hypothetical protein
MAGKSPRVPHSSANTADLFESTNKTVDQLDRIAAVQASHPERSVAESGHAPNGNHQVSNHPNDAAVEAHPANVSRVVVVDIGPNDTPLVNTFDATRMIAMSDSGKQRTTLEFSVLETRPADVLAVATGGESTESATARNPGELRGQSTEPDSENGEHFEADGVRMMPHADNPDHKKLANTDRPACFVGCATSQESEVPDPVSYGVVPSKHGATLDVTDHPESIRVLSRDAGDENNLVSCQGAGKRNLGLDPGIGDGLMDRAIEALPDRSSTELGCSAGENYPGHALRQHRLVEGERVGDQAGASTTKTSGMSGEINDSEPPHAETDFVLDEFAKLPWMAFEHEANKKHCEAAAALVTAPKTDCG